MYNRYRFQMYKVTIVSFDGAKLLFFFQFTPKTLSF